MTPEQARALKAKYQGFQVLEDRIKAANYTIETMAKYETGHMVLTAMQSFAESFMREEQDGAAIVIALRPIIESIRERDIAAIQALTPEITKEDLDAVAKQYLR